VKNITLFEESFPGPKSCGYRSFYDKNTDGIMFSVLWVWYMIIEDCW